MSHPRRNQTRRKAVKKRTPWLLWTLAGVALVLVIGIGSGYLWLRNFIHGDQLRSTLTYALGHAIHSEVQLTPLKWSGSDAFVEELTADGYKEAGFAEARAESVRASLDMKQVGRGLWSIPNISVERLRVLIDPEAETKPDTRPPPEPYKGFFAWLVPKSTEWKQVRVRDAGLAVRMPEGKATLDGVSFEALRLEGSGVHLKGTGGALNSPRLPAELKLKSFEGTAGKDEFQLASSEWDWNGTLLSARGQFRPALGSHRLRLDLQNFDIRKNVPPPWSDRVSGVLSAEGEWSGNPATESNFNGRVRVTQGIIERTPVLDRIADYTRTERFRRLVLSRCEADFRMAGKELVLENIVIESSGLLRVEGTLATQEGYVQGQFAVGVTPEALRWLPGASEKVFTDKKESAPGFVWTTMTVTGPFHEPSENLSARLMRAAGESLLIDAPLEAAGTAAKTAGDLIDQTARSVTGDKDGTGVISQGINTIRSLIPGSEAAPKEIPANLPSPTDTQPPAEIKPAEIGNPEVPANLPESQPNPPGPVNPLEQGGHLLKKTAEELNPAQFLPF